MAGTADRGPEEQQPRALPVGNLQSPPEIGVRQTTHVAVDVAREAQLTTEPIQLREVEHLAMASADLEGLLDAAPGFVDETVAACASARSASQCGL